MRRRGNNSNDTGVGCIVAAILGIIAMPIVGLVMALDNDPEKKALGWILTVVGTVLWIWMFFLN